MHSASWHADSSDACCKLQAICALPQGTPGESLSCQACLQGVCGCGRRQHAGALRLAILGEAEAQHPALALYMAVLRVYVLRQRCR